MSVLDDRAKELRPGAGRAAFGSLWPVLVGLALAVLMQLGVKPNVDSYTAIVLLNIGVNVVLAVSLTMVNGFTGQFSMGHAGFLAVGGYASGVVTYYGSIKVWGSAAVQGGVLSGMTASTEGLPFLAAGEGLFLGALLVGGLVAAALGVLVGLPSLRLRGDYLAIVTLGFGEIIRVLIQQTGSVLKPQMRPWSTVYPDRPAPEGVEQVLVYAFERRDPATNLTTTVYEAVSDVSLLEAAPRVGGALGFTGIPKYTSLFWVYLGVVVTALVAYRLKQSTFGRAFLSIREDEIASEAMGVNTTAYKVRAFVISAFFAGIAGGLFAHTLGVGLSAESAGFMKSFDIIIMVVLGGLGSISGAALAAVFVTLLPEWLRGREVTVSTLVFAIGGAILAAGIARLVFPLRRTSRPPRAGVVAAAAGGAVIAAGIVGALAFRGTFGTEVNLGDFRMIIYALGLILVMIFRPQGLFGVYEIWDRAAWSWLLKSGLPFLKKRGNA